MLMSKVMRGSIIASRISMITRWRCPSGSSLLAARGSAWLSPGRARVARSQSGSSCAVNEIVFRRRARCWARRTAGWTANPAQRKTKVEDGQRIVGGLDDVHEVEVVGGVGDVHDDHGEAERDTERRSQAEQRGGEALDAGAVPILPGCEDEHRHVDECSVAEVDD